MRGKRKKKRKRASLRRTVNPGVRHNHSARWQLQLGNLGLDALVLHHGLLDDEDLLAVARGMNEGAKADIAFDLVGRQVDNGLVKFILGSRISIQNTFCG